MGVQCYTRLPGDQFRYRCTQHIDSKTKLWHLLFRGFQIFRIISTVPGWSHLDPCSQYGADGKRIDASWSACYAVLLPCGNSLKSHFESSSPGLPSWSVVSAEVRVEFGRRASDESDEYNSLDYYWNIYSHFCLSTSAVAGSTVCTKALQGISEQIGFFQLVVIPMLSSGVLLSVRLSVRMNCLSSESCSHWFVCNPKIKWICDHL